MKALRELLSILTLSPVLFLAIGCGETHQVADVTFRGTTTTAVTKATPPTPAPALTHTPHADFWTGTSFTYYGLTFIPTYEQPCDNGSASSGEWALRCQQAAITATCQALYTLPGDSLPILTRAQANARIAWFRHRYGGFPDFMSAQDIAVGTASPGRHVCPEYPEMAVYTSTGALQFIHAPTSANEIDTVPLNAFPAGFRTTAL